MTTPNSTAQGREGPLNRREFLHALPAASLPAAALLGGTIETAPEEKSAQKLVGIQVGAVSFADEGTGKVIDVVMERAGVNTLFVAVFTYGRGIAGRQVPGQPIPDHGAREYDERTFHGGHYATPHLENYRGTSIRPERAPDLGDFDVLAAVVPEARTRGVKVYAWAEDVWREDAPGIGPAREVDLHGRPRGSLCFRQPDHLAFLEGLARDLVSSYPIDGLMWGSERMGPLGQVLGLQHGGAGDPGRAGCFCARCVEAARARGIDPERARRGYEALEALVRDSRAGRRPRDGHLVSFLRVLLRHPEVLAWETMWSDAQHDAYRRIRQAVRASGKDVPVGFHIWHLNSFSPLWRAEQDLEELSAAADFFKVVVYNNCGGPRLASFVGNLTGGLLRDVPPPEALSLLYQVLDYRERPLAEISGAGLSADYVARETRRALQGTAGKAKVYPGIDIDIPTGPGEKRTEPRDVREAVAAALGAGADGVILSRKYSEMSLANLSAAGEGLRAAGIGK